MGDSFLSFFFKALTWRSSYLLKALFSPQRMHLCHLNPLSPDRPSTGVTFLELQTLWPLLLLPDMTLDDVRDYERKMHEKTNIKVCNEEQEHSTTNPSAQDDIEVHDKASVCVFFIVSFLHQPSSVSYLNHWWLTTEGAAVAYNYLHLTHSVKLCKTW